MSTEWKRRREGGGRFAIGLIRWIGSRFGRAPARLLLYPITAYFLLRRHGERRDSRAFLSRAFGRPATLPEVARHIHTFAATILDRLYLLSESTRRFEVAVSGVETLHRHLDAGRGVLLFGSHLGSFEVLRVLSRQRPEYRIRVVLDRAHGRATTELLDALNPEIAATVIDAGQDGPSIALAVGEALAQGAMVALLVDRSHDGGQTEEVVFFGEPAGFPVAPWMMAAVLKVPVMLAFGLYRGGNRYDLVFEPFSEGIALPRAQRRQGVAALIQRYAARLEHHARDAPYNWFNFYDFWKRDDRGAPRDGAAGPAGGAGAGDPGGG